MRGGIDDEEDAPVPITAKQPRHLVELSKQIMHIRQIKEDTVIKRSHHTANEMFKTSWL